MKVTTDKLTKVFLPAGRKGGTGVVAVNCFDMELPDGKLIGLLGPSGCGKSTVLNLLCGLLKPTEGRIFFGDEDVTDVPAERRGVGMVFQNYALYPHMTVFQNIVFPLENLRGKERLGRDEMKARVMEVAALVQLESLLDRRPGELSGGQQQRVAIARALVKLPRVLLMDEPLSNLDARLRLQTREEICRIQKKTGVTTVFVTHDQEEAMSISDIIVVMRDGTVQQVGAPQEIYDDPVNLFVAKFLGTPPINVFSGSIREGRLFVGDCDVLPAVGAADGQVHVAVRPEGFVLDENGPLTGALEKVEVMGRDVSVVFDHAESESGTLRAIIDSDEMGLVRGPAVRFSLKPSKVAVFDRETETRIRFSDDTAYGKA